MSGRDDKKIPRVPQLLVEKLVGGALSEQEAADVRARLEAAGELERVEQTQDSNGALLERFEPGAFMQQVRARAHVEEVAEAEQTRTRTSNRRWLFAPMLAAAAAAGLFLFMLRSENGTPWVEPDIVVTKGLDARLHLYRQGPVGDPVQLQAGAHTSAGDALQLAYVAAGAAHGVILSIDGNASVTLHFPPQPQGSTALQQGGEIALVDGYRLDNAPGFERFFLVTSAQPIDVPTVQALAQKLARSAHAQTSELELDAGQTQTSLLVRK